MSDSDEDQTPASPSSSPPPPPKRSWNTPKRRGFSVGPPLVNYLSPSSSRGGSSRGRMRSPGGPTPERSNQSGSEGPDPTPEDTSEPSHSAITGCLFPQSVIPQSTNTESASSTIVETSRGPARLFFLPIEPFPTISIDKLPAPTRSTFDLDITRLLLSGDSEERPFSSASTRVGTSTASGTPNRNSTPHASTSSSLPGPSTTASGASMAFSIRIMVNPSGDLTHIAADFPQTMDPESLRRAMVRASDSLRNPEYHRNRENAAKLWASNRLRGIQELRKATQATVDAALAKLNADDSKESGVSYFCKVMLSNEEWICKQRETEPYREFSTLFQEKVTLSAFTLDLHILWDSDESRVQIVPYTSDKLSTLSSNAVQHVKATWNQVESWLTQASCLNQVNQVTAIYRSGNTADGDASLAVFSKAMQGEVNNLLDTASFTHGSLRCTVIPHKAGIFTDMPSSLGDADCELYARVYQAIDTASNPDTVVTPTPSSIAVDNTTLEVRTYFDSGKPSIVTHTPGRRVYGPRDVNDAWNILAEQFTGQVYLEKVTHAVKTYQSGNSETAGREFTEATQEAANEALSAYNKNSSSNWRCSVTAISRRRGRKFPLSDEDMKLATRLQKKLNDAAKGASTASNAIPTPEEHTEDTGGGGDGSTSF